MRVIVVRRSLRPEKLWVLVLAALGVALIVIGTMYFFVSPSHLPALMPGARTVTRANTHYHKRGLLCYAVAALLFVVAYANSVLRIRLEDAPDVSQARGRRAPSQDAPPAHAHSRRLSSPRVLLGAGTAAALLGALVSFALDWSAVNTLCSALFYLGVGTLAATLAIDGVLALRRRRWERGDRAGSQHRRTGPRA